MNDKKKTDDLQKPAHNRKEESSELMQILEALLFASDDLLTVAKMKKLLPENPDARIIKKMIDKINIQFQKQNHPFEIVEIGGGYQFQTVPYYQPWVQQLFKEKSHRKLSIQALECLAIIAYKQPVSKSQIESIRGVLSDGAMKTLLEKHLVTITGRSDKPGRPLLYGTTQEFLKYFSINKLDDLPRIKELENIAREEMEHDIEASDFFEPEHTEDGEVDKEEFAESEEPVPEKNIESQKPDDPE